MMTVECPSHVSRSPDDGGASKSLGSTCSTGTGVGGSATGLIADNAVMAPTMSFHMGSMFSKMPPRYWGFCSIRARRGPLALSPKAAQPLAITATAKTTKTTKAAAATRRRRRQREGDEDVMCQS